MPRNGSGEYNLPYNWNDDKANGIMVLASRMQNQDQDIANALTGSVASDGQTPLTGNLDFNGNRAIDLNNGINAQDATTIDQVQTGELQYYGISSTIPLGVAGVDYEVSANPNLSEYVDGLKFDFIAHIDCLDNPVLRAEALAELDMVKEDGAGGYTNLVAGDLLEDSMYQLYYNETIGADKILVLNPEVQNINASKLAVKGKFSTTTGATQTIASGIITAPCSNFLIDTEGAAATDDLDTINGGVDGMFLAIGNVADARNVVVKHNTGNIFNPAGIDIVLDITSNKVEAIYSGALSKWVITSAPSLAPIFIAQDQKPSGTDGGSSSSGVNVRVLNTVIINTISNASLSSNQITLPAGTYRIQGSCPTYAGAQGHRCYLYNVTDSSNSILGTSSFNGSGVGAESYSLLNGIITISTSKVFELRHYLANGVATQGLGVAAGSGANEIYAQISIEKIG